MTRIRWLIRLAVIAIAAPAAAHASAGRIGTGHGRAGAIAALVLGLTGMVLGRLALTRSRRTDEQPSR